MYICGSVSFPVSCILLNHLFLKRFCIHHNFLEYIQLKKSQFSSLFLLLTSDDFHIGIPTICPFGDSNLASLWNLKSKAVTLTKSAGPPKVKLLFLVHLQNLQNFQTDNSSIFAKKKTSFQTLKHFDHIYNYTNCLANCHFCVFKNELIHTITQNIYSAIFLWW